MAVVFKIKLSGMKGNTYSLKYVFMVCTNYIMCAIQVPALSLAEFCSLRNVCKIIKNINPV